MSVPATTWGVGFAGCLPAPARPAALCVGPLSSFTFGSGHPARSGLRRLLTPSPRVVALQILPLGLPRDWPVPVLPRWSGSTEHRQKDRRARSNEPTLGDGFECVRTLTDEAPRAEENVRAWFLPPQIFLLGKRERTAGCRSEECHAGTFRAVLGGPPRAGMALDICEPRPRNGGSCTEDGR